MTAQMTSVGAPVHTRIWAANRPVLFAVTLAGLGVAVSVLSLSAGAVQLGLGDVLRAVTGFGDPGHTDLILQFQLPRVLLCWLVGAGLAISGGVLQGVIRNSLAAPDIVGITKGAGLAALVVVLAVPAAPVIALPVTAFLGGLAAAILVYVFAYRRGTTPARLALVGIAVSALCEAGMRLLLVQHPLDINGALVWLTGSLFGRAMGDVYQIAPWILVLVPLVLYYARRLDVLGLGDDLAAGLGEPVERTRRIVLLLAVALASASVAVAGTIGFVGLIAPHIARRLVGGRHLASLPAAAMVGVLLMLLADAAGRGIHPPLEIPAGLITALVGGPYFLYLLAKTGK